MILMEEWEQKDELIILRRDHKILTRPIKAITNGKKAWRRWRRGVIGITPLGGEPCEDCLPAWKRKQRGSLMMMGAASGGNRIAGDGSNFVFSHNGTGASVVAGARFQQDGYVDDLGPFTEQVEQTVQEWFNNKKDPVGNPGDDFDIRTVSMTLGTWDDEAAAVGVWINIGTGRNWREIRTCCDKADENAGTDTASSPFELRHGFETLALGGFDMEASATVG